MVEFLQNYGLWIALVGVFVGMHWFGMGCCGGGHRHGQGQRPQGPPGEEPKAEKGSGAVSKSSGSCH